MTFLIHLFNCYTAKEYNEVVDYSNQLWKANKKLMLQVQDLHNRLEIEKIHPFTAGNINAVSSTMDGTKAKRGRPKKK